ncbi:MAG: type II secretion system protein [Patescibacteria group bacterium]
MKKFSQRGFTLIELLVVIAIIGILSSVVLASLNTARSKGADASIKANLNGIRPQAEIYYDANNNYGAAGAASATTSNIVVATACDTGLFADANIQAALTAAQSAAGGDSVLVTCGSFGSPVVGWAIAVPLKSDTAAAWCISSSGNARQILSASPLTVSNTCY